MLVHVPAFIRLRHALLRPCCAIDELCTSIAPHSLWHSLSLLSPSPLSLPFPLFSFPLFLPPSSPPPRFSTMASGAVTKRLQSELMGLMMEPVPGVTAFPDGDSLNTWTGTLTPDGDSVYAGCAFKLGLSFPGNYPLVPPSVRFVTRVWHPNVDYPSGAICLDLLKDAWSPSLTVRTLLISILSLLDEPNNASPLNGEAARGWPDRLAFVAVAKAKYNEEATAGGGGSSA